jgi:hypothetical protein
VRTALRLCLALLVAGPQAFVACGSRTGLLVPPPGDAATDVVIDMEVPDVDAAVEEDAADAAVEEDAAIEEEGLPVLDVTFPDAPGCADSGATLVYLVTQEGNLLSFDPATLTPTLIGPVSCPSASSPFSMAVDRSGIAYVLYADGSLWRVDTATAKCAATSYTPDQQGFSTFGMGYSADVPDAGGADGGETLYVDQELPGGGGSPSLGLARIDTETMRLAFIAPFSPPTTGMELTGDGTGRLFGFAALVTGGSHVAEIDPANGDILSDNQLSVGMIGDGWAFALWGGKFWIFTSPGGTTTVTEFDPTTGLESTATALMGTVVGAGVSTCAPE